MPRVSSTEMHDVFGDAVSAVRDHGGESHPNIAIGLGQYPTPFANMPESLQAVMVINPLRYALDITKRVYLEDAGFVQLLFDFIPLTVIGFVTPSGTRWLFGQRLT